MGRRVITRTASTKQSGIRVRMEGWVMVRMEESGVMSGAGQIAGHVVHVIVTHQVLWMMSRNRN